MEDSKFATLRLAARPGSALDEFNVYYLAFKNHYGLVKVKLSANEMRFPPNQLKAIAEVKALEYLLAGIEVLSHGRKGDSVHITATSRAIKEIMLINKLSKPMRDQLLNEAKSLKYIKGTNLPLACYRAMSGLMPSLIARFLAATIVISDDVKWINPVVPEKNVHQHFSNEQIMHRVEINGIGKIAVTAHAYNRFVQRSKNNNPEKLWDYFLETLRQPTLKLSEYTDELVEYNMQKYGYLARHYYCSKTRWHFVIVEHEGELVLVTSALREVNLNDYTKR